MTPTFKRSLRWFGLASALTGSACSGDDAPPPLAGPGGIDAGSGGANDASSGGTSGATSAGGRSDAAAAGTAGTGASGRGGASGSAGSGGGSSNAGGADASPGTGGSVAEAGIVDGGQEGSTDGAIEAEAAPCVSPRRPCPSACADLTNDPNNCGTCSHACAALEACVNGTCTSAHCGGSAKFTAEAEIPIAATSPDGGASDGGGGSVASPNRVLLASNGPGGVLDAWIASSEGVYRAPGGGTSLLSSPLFALSGASQSLAVTKLEGDGGAAMSALVQDGLTDVVLAIGSPQSGYSGAGAISVGEHEGSVLAVDIDGDGRNEIVVAALSISDNQISVSIYKVPPLDRPSLWRSRVLPLGGSLDAYGLAAGNFDGDGYRDIAVAAYGSMPVLVTLQNTPSDLSDPVVHALAGGRVRSPLVHDFDNDGYDDVVAVAGPSIHFFTGSSTGLASNPLTTTPEQTYSYADAAAGDFDRDGKFDLALVRRLPASGTQIVPAWGDAHGNFVPDFTQAISPPAVSGIAAGDIDADSRVDLVVISSDRGSITAIRNGCN